MKFNHIAWIALGGALGAGLRYGFLMLNPFGSEYAFWVIMLENIAGSFLLGLLVGLIGRQVLEEHPWGSFLGTGLLGSFTTFSAFSIDLYLTASISYSVAAVYGIVSVAGGLAAAITGIKLAGNMSSEPR